MTKDSSDTEVSLKAGYYSENFPGFVSDLIARLPALALLALERLVADFRLDLPTIEAA